MPQRFWPEGNMQAAWGPFHGIDGSVTQEPLGLGPPFNVGGAPSYGPRPFAQQSPAIAFDGSDCLVVWLESDNGGVRINGTRITQSGVVLDPLPLELYSSSFELGYPDLAFDGDNYLVVWSEDCAGQGYEDIYAVRVAPSGTVLDSEKIEISTANLRQRFPKVAFDGNNCLVVWEDSRGSRSGDLYCARVSPSGEVLDPDGILVATPLNSLLHPAVSFGGANYLIVWEDWSLSGSPDILGARVSPEGVVLDPEGIPISTAYAHQSFPAVAFDGECHLVAWIDTRDADWEADDISDIYCTRVTPDGRVPDADGVAVSTIGSIKYSLSVSFDGTNYGVMWDDGRDRKPSNVYAARVTPSGSVLDPDGKAITRQSLGQVDVDVAFNGNSYMAVWQSGTGDPSPTIYGARITPSGAVLDPDGIPISMGAASQLSPDVDFDGEDYMIVWTEVLGNSSVVRGARVSSTRRIVAPEAKTISPNAYVHSNPSMAFDGRNYLVAWEGAEERHAREGIRAVRVTSSGKVLDLEDISLSAPACRQTAPDVGFDGRNYLVVWSEQPERHHPQFDTLLVKGARISPSGEVLDEDFIQLSTNGWCESPALSFDGTNYLVVWSCKEIRGTRVSTSGSVLDAEGFTVSPPGGHGAFPAVAFDDSNYLVVWAETGVDQDGIPTGYYIRGARVAPSGSILDQDGIAISNECGDRSFPTVSFDGTHYIVMWKDERNGKGGIYGTLVTPSGEVLDPDGFTFAVGGEKPSAPAMALGRSGQVILTYSSFTPGDPYDAHRIWANLSKVVGVGPPVELSVAPNPFNTTVRISYNLPNESRVRLGIYDAKGRLVKTIARGYVGPGWTHETWDGTDAEGRVVTSGIYFARIQCRYGVASKKCVLVK